MSWRIRFCWTDEIPLSIDRLSENLLRMILRYRTTLILGVPDSKWEPFWVEAVREFPAWIGFLPERQQQSETCKGRARR